MNEMDELVRMRASVPDGPPSGRARTALLEAMRAERARMPAWAGHPGRGRGRRRGLWRAPRAVLAGGLALGCAAALTTVLLTQPGPGLARPSAHGLTVHELAYRSAAAAETAPPVSPGQWVYRSGVEKFSHHVTPFHVWTTADDSKAAVQVSGKLQFVRGPLTGLPVLVNGKLVVLRGPLDTLPDPSHAAEAFYVGPLESPAIDYNRLGSLPKDPRALEHSLEGLPRRGLGSPAHKAFSVAADLVSSYVMPPEITATLMRAIGEIPGVTVDNHAMDAAGRPGVGFVFTDRDGARQEIVMDPHTFRFMGTQSVLQHPGGPLTFGGGTAFLQQELVSGPGEFPPGARR
jgi:hypothetical protein